MENPVFLPSIMTLISQNFRGLGYYAKIIYQTQLHIDMHITRKSPERLTSWGFLYNIFTFYSTQIQLDHNHTQVATHYQALTAH